VPFDGHALDERSERFVADRKIDDMVIMGQRTTMVG